MGRVETTLFMLESVDGKITTGANDTMDFDADLPKIRGAKEGLQQYYDLEQATDLLSLTTGRVMVKIGVNEKHAPEKNSEVSFVVIDNGPHLTPSGVKYLSEWVKKVFVVTTNKNHPAVDSGLSNVEVITFESDIDFEGLFEKLKTEYGFDKMTVQSGGTLNALLLRAGLIDHLSIVIAPALVGGANTSTLIDGESLHSVSELSKIKALKLIDCIKMKDSYLHLKYDVLNEEKL